MSVPTGYTILYWYQQLGSTLLDYQILIHILSSVSFPYLISHFYISQSKKKIIKTVNYTVDKIMRILCKLITVIKFFPQIYRNSFTQELNTVVIRFMCGGGRQVNGTAVQSRFLISLCLQKSKQL